MNKIAITFWLCISSFSVFSSSFILKRDSVGLTKISDKFYIRYMVSPGETVYRISTKYKTPISDLIDINPELEFGLKTGQIINIPYNKVIQEPEKSPEKQVAKAPVTPPATAVSPKPMLTGSDTVTEKGLLHTVQPGETFSGLAQKYGITVDELIRLNNIELKPGQKVVVNNRIKASKSDAPANTGQPQATLPVKKEPAVAVAKAEAFEDEPGAVRKLIPEDYENTKMHLLIIPFDPYLYFSDADDEISATSKIQRTKVRQAFRRRLNALLDPPGYETIRLLGGTAKDSITDLNKIYSSVTYSYQEILNSEYNPRLEKNPEKALGGDKNTVQKKLPGLQTENTRASFAKDAQKYFGVKINNPDFFTFFNNKYKIDYYLFVNQFEVKTNYENCLDRATLNYERGFTTHYSIFDKNGKQIAGSRIYTEYNSNTNSIAKILSDNMQKVADRIMADLPKAK